MLFAPFDAFARLGHDSGVGSRWFIPLSLMVFAAICAGLWAYLSATEEVPARKLILDEPVSQEQPAPSKSVSNLNPLKAKQVGHVARRPSLPDLSEQLDDAAMKLRAGLIEQGGVEVLRAQNELGLGHFETALRASDRVLGNSRNNTAALATRAAALAGLTRWNEAEKAYLRLIEAAPKDQSARYNFGVLLYRRAKFGEASEQFRELIALNPTHAQGLYNLATLAQREGRTAEARSSLLTYVALRPSVPSGWFNLGVLFADLDEPDEAARCFAIFHALAPDDPDGAVNLSRSLIEAEHLEFAREVLASAFRSNPCDLTILESVRELTERLEDAYPTDSESSRRMLLNLDELISALE